MNEPYQLDPETLADALQRSHNGFSLQAVIGQAINQEIAKGRLRVPPIEITNWKAADIGTKTYRETPEEITNMIHDGTIMGHIIIDDPATNDHWEFSEPEDTESEDA